MRVSVGGATFEGMPLQKERMPEKVLRMLPGTQKKCKTQKICILLHYLCAERVGI